MRERLLPPGSTRVYWTRPRVLTERGTGNAIEINDGIVCVRLDAKHGRKHLYMSAPPSDMTVIA